MKIRLTFALSVILGLFGCASPATPAGTAGRCADVRADKEKQLQEQVACTYQDRCDSCASSSHMTPACKQWCDAPFMSISCDRESWDRREEAHSDLAERRRGECLRLEAAANGHIYGARHKASSEACGECKMSPTEMTKGCLSYCAAQYEGDLPKVSDEECRTLIQADPTPDNYLRQYACIMSMMAEALIKAAEKGALQPDQSTR